jgi:hypothetical protein
MESNNVGAVREPPTIEQRLEKLEKQAGQWRRMAMRLYGIALAFGAGFILMFALAAVKPDATQDVIRAKRLEIVDDKGKTRISLVALPKYGPLLQFSDDKGNHRAGLSLGADGPALWLEDETGRGRAGLIVDANGPGLRLFDEKSRERAGLTADADGADFALRDKDGKVIWQAPPK